MNHHAISRCAALVIALGALGFSSVAQAQRASSPASTPAEARARYALPWVMRPAIAPTLSRIESSINARRDGVTAVTLLTAGAAVLPATLGFYARLGVTNSVLTTSNPATNGIATGAVTNPLAFVLFTPELRPGLRLALFLGATLPIGTGGGDSPPTLSASSISTGGLTRSSMDNALFAVNYLAIAPGASLAYMISGLTFQADVTLFQLIRTRGEHAMSATDAYRTNFTSGLSVGYLAHPRVTVSAELHYQHWISAPNLLNPTSGVAPAPGQLSATVGARANVPLARTVLARPGLSFSMGLGGAMFERECKVFQLDIPVTY